MTQTTPIIVKRNAYGMRWHVITDRGLVYSGRTKRACVDYIRRRAAAAMQVQS